MMQIPRFWRRHALLWAVLSAHALLWGAINLIISPHPDTIDHWVQSRIFSLGYQEHPPVIAWLLRGLTSVLGSSEASLEIGAQAVNLAILALTYALARSAFGGLAAVLSVLFLEATLYFSAGSTVLQIDQPLMLCWLASLWCLLAYQRTRDVRWLILMGLCAGLGGISKYTMVLFYLGLAVAITIVPALRREWLNPFQYLGGLTALLVVSPHLLWNSRVDWVSVRHQLGKAAPDASAFPGQFSLEFTLGYVLLFSLPLIAWGLTVMPRALKRQARSDGPVAWLLWISLTPLAFFTLALLRGSFADPKWANVSFLGLYILLGKAAADLWKAGGRNRVRNILVGAHSLNFALIALVLWHVIRPFAPIPAEKDPTHHLIGWRETVSEAESLLRGAGVSPPEYVVSLFYPLAAEFSLRLSSQPLTHSLERPWRNLWSPLDRLNESNTVIVCEFDCDRQAQRIRDRTGLNFQYLGQAAAPALGLVRHRVSLYRVTGRVADWIPPERRPPPDVAIPAVNPAIRP